MPDMESQKLPPYWAVPFSSYAEVTDFLGELETTSIQRGRPPDGTVNFGAIAQCLQELGRPDRAYRSVHVTGTNGKTSVSRMTAALLQAGGQRVGLYTSPHLGQFRERICINGQPISEQDLLDACNHLKSLMDCVGVDMSPFEFLTAAAFFAFRSAGVDYAVVEVGIGGRAGASCHNRVPGVRRLLPSPCPDGGISCGGMIASGAGTSTCQRRSSLARF